LIVCDGGIGAGGRKRRVPPENPQQALASVTIGYPR
jgi:hypothetical protein